MKRLIFFAGASAAIFHLPFFADAGLSDISTRNAIEAFTDASVGHSDCRRYEPGEPLNTWWSKGKFLCPLMNQYRGRFISFTPSDPPHPCATFLDGKKTVYDSLSPSERDDLSRYGTDDFIPKSRARLLNEDGYTVKNTLQRTLAMSEALAIGVHVGTACCGTNSACWRAFRATTIRICESPRNVNMPDPCSQGAYFDPSYKARKPGVAQPGTMIISPYNRPGYDDSLTLTHEFSHACSDIWTQLRDPSGDGYNNGNCEVTRANIDHYKFISSSLSAGSDLMPCIARAASANSRSSTGYIPGACAATRLEEGYAVASAALLQSDARFALSIIFPKMCELMPSTLHPYAGDVLKCLLATSPKIRSALKLELLCTN